MGRPDDTFGFAGVINVGSAFSLATESCRIPVASRSSSPNFGFPLSFWRVTLDYRLVVNPAYNRDRGPVSVLGARLHAQF